MKYRVILYLSILMVVGCDTNQPVTMDGITSGDGGVALASAAASASDPGLVVYAELSDEELWAYVERSGGRVDVGLKQPGQASGMSQGRIIASEATEAAGKRAILSIKGMEFTYEDELLPQVGLDIPNVTALSRLRALPFVDYVEPTALLLPDSSPSAWMSWSCGYDDYGDVSSLYTVPQGDKLSSRIGSDVHAAWSRSSGSGVTISFVGTGVSSDQPQLNADFESGESSGRTITRQYREQSPSANPWHDDCGHETKLIANAAAPLDGRGVAGIAYKSSVFSVRSDNDTHLTEDSYNIQLGIRDAVVAGKIVNMAFGSTDTKTNIKNEIQYWHLNGYAGEERMFVGAAGTSSSVTNHIMMFPSNLPEVVGVTGTDPDDGACDGRCHYDQKVDFGLPTAEPTVLGSGYTIGRGGGSSHATSTFSAMAALVWSRFPSDTRAQVINRLAMSSPYHPNLGGSGKRTDTGWATPTLNCALGGLCKVTLDGGSNANYATSGETFSFSSQLLGNTAVPVTYLWSAPEGAYIVGPNNQATVTFQASYPSERVDSAVILSVTDQVSGRRIRLTRAFAVGPGAVDCPPGASCEIGEF